MNIYITDRYFFSLQVWSKICLISIIGYNSSLWFCEWIRRQLLAVFCPETCNWFWTGRSGPINLCPGDGVGWAPFQGNVWNYHMVRIYICIMSYCPESLACSRLETARNHSICSLSLRAHILEVSSNSNNMFSF